MSEANKLLAQRFFDEILTRQNFAVCREVMAEHYVEHALAPFGQSEPGSVAGPEHAQSAAEWLHAQFPDIRMRVEMTITEGDLVACRVFSEGTNLGPFNGTIPPTGGASPGGSITGSESRTTSLPNTGRCAKICR